MGTERHKAINGQELEGLADTHGSAVGRLLLQPRWRPRGWCRNPVINWRPREKLSFFGKRRHQRWTKNGLSASFMSLDPLATIVEKPIAMLVPALQMTSNQHMSSARLLQIWFGVDHRFWRNPLLFSETLAPEVVRRGIQHMRWNPRVPTKTDRPHHWWDGEVSHIETQQPSRDRGGGLKMEAPAENACWSNFERDTTQNNEDHD